MTFSIEYLFWLLGVLLIVVGAIILRDRSHPRRASAGGFWILYGFVFLAGNLVPLWTVGVVVILLALVAGFGGVTGARPVMPAESERKASAIRLGNKLFVPALIIPLVTVAGTLLAPYLVFGGKPLLDPKAVNLVAFGIGCIVALAAACVITRDTVMQSTRETRRLLDALSWAVVLPQMLGMLGLVFSAAGVGAAVAHVSTAYIDLDYRFVAVAVYCIGMALFTVVMGNGFAAFPVMTGGIGVPVLVGVFHGNPAPMVAIGMFSGYCGTLLTPMAANYNMVPAALLELPDKYGVIKVQVPTALIILAVNIVLLNIFMFL